jgi:hypothetical protein
MKYGKPEIALVGPATNLVESSKALGGKDHQFTPDVWMTVSAYQCDE